MTLPCPHIVRQEKYVLFLGFQRAFISLLFYISNVCIFKFKFFQVKKNSHQFRLKNSENQNDLNIKRNLNIQLFLFQLALRKEKKETEERKAKKAQQQSIYMLQGINLEKNTLNMNIMTKIRGADQPSSDIYIGIGYRWYRSHSKLMQLERSEAKQSKAISKAQMCTQQRVLFAI